MKTVKKVGLASSDLLSAARQAEASLARREAEDLENGLPEGHPLRNEADKQKALLGDLSGLPPGHPLLVAMQKAKEVYEQTQAQKQMEQAKTADLKKSKKIDEEKARKAARQQEEERKVMVTDAAKEIDYGISGTLDEVRKLYKVMSEHEELLNNDPLCRSKVGRLRRLLFAAERGLSECRLAKVRA